MRRWSKAKTGEGQVVLLSGEADIGKSRLTAAPLEPLATDPHARLALFLLSATYGKRILSNHRSMERAAGLAHDDGLNAKLDKLDALLVQTSGCLKRAMNDAPVGLGAIMRASTESSINKEFAMIACDSTASLTPG